MTQLKTKKQNTKLITRKINDWKKTDILFSIIYEVWNPNKWDKTDWGTRHVVEKLWGDDEKELRERKVFNFDFLKKV